MTGVEGTPGIVADALMATASSGSRGQRRTRRRRVSPAAPPPSAAACSSRSYRRGGARRPRARRAPADQRRRAESRRRGTGARARPDGAGAAREPVAARPPAASRPHGCAHRPEQPAQAESTSRTAPGRDDRMPSCCSTSTASRPTTTDYGHGAGDMFLLNSSACGPPERVTGRGRGVPHGRRRVLRAGAAGAAPVGELSATAPRRSPSRGDGIHDHGRARRRRCCPTRAGTPPALAARRRAHVPARRAAAAGRPPPAVDVLMAVVAGARARLASHVSPSRSSRATAPRSSGSSGGELEALRHAAALCTTSARWRSRSRSSRKPAPLSDSEWSLIRRHTLIGERILAAAPALERSARLVRWSHERIDGKGYPDGLAGEEIPLGSRIILVADAFDAMVLRAQLRREALANPMRSPSCAAAPAASSTRTWSLRSSSSPRGAQRLRCPAGSRAAGAAGSPASGWAPAWERESASRRGRAWGTDSARGSAAAWASAARPAASAAARRSRRAAARPRSARSSPRSRSARSYRRRAARAAVTAAIRVGLLASLSSPASPCPWPCGGRRAASAWRPGAARPAAARQHRQCHPVRDRLGRAGLRAPRRGRGEPEVELVGARPDVPGASSSRTCRSATCPRCRSSRTSTSSWSRARWSPSSDRPGPARRPWSTS